MYKFFRKVESRSINMPMGKFIKTTLPNQKADKAFQANEFTRWTEEMASSFMTSIITNKAPSKYIFCDIKKCYDSAVEEERYDDIVYYKKWLDLEVKFLNLDSNNRCINLNSFIKDKIGIQEGTYQVDGIYKISNTNNTYKKLPKNLKESFLSSNVSVEIYDNVTRDELSDIFRRLNDGKPLNEPEKRNASTSDTANAIRTFADKHRKLFFNSKSKWFTKNQVNRKHLDDFIAGMFYTYPGLSNNPSKSTNLDMMYEIGSEIEKTSLSLTKKRFKEFLKWFDKGHIYVLPNRNNILDLWHLFVHLKNEKYELKQGHLKQFIQHYATIVGHLLKSQKKYKGNPKDKQTFEFLLGGRQAKNNEVRFKLIKSLLDVNAFFIKLDKRVVSDNEKLMTAARDNFTTHEGKKIQLSKFNDGKTYHKGHKKNFRDTGKTNVDNTVIQEAKDNLKQGQRSIDN